MFNCIQKYKKSATALALVFAVSYSGSLSASNIRYQGQDIIDENADSLDAIRGKFALSMRLGGDVININAPSIPLDVDYQDGINVARNDLQAVKNAVIQSPLLTYPELYEDHQNAFKQKIVTAYNNTVLAQCDNFLDRTRDLSVKLFKVSQNQLSRSKNRNEWALDETLGGVFTFTLNNNQKVSILVRDLGVVLPLYSNHRHPDPHSMAPWVEPQENVQLTPDQLITSQFINRIFMGEIPGNPLKRGIKFRLENRTGLTLDELVNRFTGRNVPLQIVPRASNLAEFDRTFIERQLLPYLSSSVRGNPGYQNYQNFTTMPGTGYTVGMNLDDYRETWFSNYLVVYQGFPDYDPPSTLLTRTDFDKKFIRRHLLPVIRDQYNWPSYQTYKAFSTMNSSGYTADKNLEEYMERWRPYPSVYNRFPSYNDHVPEHLMTKSEFDKKFVRKQLIPYLIVKYPKSPGYQNYQEFITSPGTGYTVGKDMRVYMDSWLVGYENIYRGFPAYVLPEHLRN